MIQTIVGGQADFGPVDLTGSLLQVGNGQAKDFTVVAAIQQRARVLFVVCNNGESVSLKKQAAGLGKASKSGTDKSTAAEDEVRVGVIEIAKVLEEAETDG